ncbi:MAG: glycosyltransferase [Microgenomates group bacterium]
MNKFFSIIIPTLNEEKYLPNLLNDLFRQKEKDFEVIVIDGYSQDKTKEIALAYKKKLDLFFFQSDKKNVASQRNFGAQKAQGQYLVFLDADSRIQPTFLYKVKKNIFKNKGLVFLPFIKPDKKNKIYQPLFDLANLLIEFIQMTPKKFSLGGSVIIEKNFFQLIGGFNDKLFISEDHELIQRVSDWGVKIKFIKNSPVVFSLRRIKKEGEIKFFYKYFLAAAKRLLSNKEITQKIFDYEMGGQLYNDENKKTISEVLNNYLLKIKKLYKKFLKEIT